MNAKLAKLLIFSLGAAVGAVISALVTKKIVSKVYWEECDYEINEAANRYRAEIKAVQAENEELKQTISQQKVAIQVLTDQVAGKKPVENGAEEVLSDSEDDRSDYISAKKGPKKPSEEPFRAKYGPSYDDEEDEEGVDDNIPSSEEIQEVENYQKVVGPYLITEELFDTTALDYQKEGLRYFIFDGRVVTEDGEWLENYPLNIGTDWLAGKNKSGDVKFVRNEYYETDYVIEFIAGYGEEHITIFDDED